MERNAAARPTFRRIRPHEIGLDRLALNLVREGRGERAALRIPGDLLRLSATAVDLLADDGWREVPFDEALRLASEAAANHGGRVDVIDPDGLWRPGWGPLEEAGSS